MQARPSAPARGRKAAPPSRSGWRLAALLALALAACGPDGQGAIDARAYPVFDGPTGGPDVLVTDGGDGMEDAAGAGDGLAAGDLAGRDLVGLPLPGAPTLSPLAAAAYRYQPYDVAWRQAAGDGAAGVVVVRFEVQESKDASFATGVTTIDVAPPATFVARVQPKPGFAGAPSVTLYYRVRTVGTGGPGPFSAVGSKAITATWAAAFKSAGSSPPINPPFTLAANAFVVDDVNSKNTRGRFEKSGPGWLDNSAPAFGYLGHYWHVSDHAALPRDGSERAKWTPAIQKAGKYEVWVSCFRTNNRDDHVEYFVTSTDGAALGPFTFSHYDAVTGHYDTAWVLLGEFNFAAGSTGWVELIWSKEGARHSESADAAAFRLVPR